MINKPGKNIDVYTEEQDRVIGERYQITMLQQELKNVNRVLWALLIGRSEPLEVSFRDLHIYDKHCTISYKEDVKNRCWWIAADYRGPSQE